VREGRSQPTGPQPAAAVTGRGREAWCRLNRAVRCLAGADGDEQSRPDLISTLNDVAAAVSSAVDVDDVLDVVVGYAKSIVGGEKAALVLTDHHGERLDFDTLVVRGRRDQHDEAWWGGRLDLLSAEALEQGLPIREEHGENGATLIVNPILVKDRRLGLLAVINSQDHELDQSDVDALRILSSFAASAIENAQLAEQSRYVLLASERDRIAREMHDGVVQSLFSISLSLELCKKQVSREPAGVVTRMDDIQEQLKRAMTELRRYIYDLRPMKLAEFGLVGAIDYWIREITLGVPVHSAVNVVGEVPTLRPSEEACLYRVAKESVANVVKHADASTLSVVIEFSPGMAELTVTDDGVGFDVDAVFDGGTTGIGLSSILARVHHEGGTLCVERAEPHGTRLHATLPIGGRQ